MGAGEIGIAWTIEQKVFLYHTVDGDKDGKRAEARLDLSPIVEDFQEMIEEESDPCQEPATGK